MKVIFVHYYFIDDGVTRVVLNNINGLRQLSDNFDFALVGNSFSASLPEFIEKRFLDLNSDPDEQLKSMLQDADVVIFENPTIGMFPEWTIAFRKFSRENSDKHIIYRIHDFIDDRPNLLKKLPEFSETPDSIYPLSDNVIFLALTSKDKNRLIDKGLKEVQILPNSIVTADLTSDKSRPALLRKLLEKKGILSNGEKILLYPVRVFRRKNIEEALLIAKLLNQEGENFRLIVTIPFDEDYLKELKDLSEEHNIVCSIGEAGNYIGFDKSKGFTIADMYSLADVVISTSVMEGFGFSFIEPWISGTPVIGRKIDDVTSDFEDSGIDMSHFYDNSLLNADDDPEIRFENIKKILSDPQKLRGLSESLNLKNRIEQAMKIAERNSQKVTSNYDYVSVARKLCSYIMPQKHIQLNF